MQVPDGLYHEVGSFTPYALNSSIWVILTSLITEQSWLQRTKMRITGLIPTGLSGLESSHACHLHMTWFPGRLPAPFRAFSHRAIISKTTPSGPQQVFARAGQPTLLHCDPVWGGRGLKGSNATCSSLSWLSVTSSATHKHIGPLWC